MGTVVKCSELARASRARLFRRMVDASALIDGTEDTFKHYLEVGRLIHTEALLAYSSVETPGTLAATPWYHVITRLRDEHGMEPRQVQNANNAVMEYLTALAQSKAAQRVG